MKLDEVLKLVEALNQRGFETVGAAAWYVETDGTGIAVKLHEFTIWNSEEDERENIGTCPACKGSGKAKNPADSAGSTESDFKPYAMAGGICGDCGGDGKNHDEFESLALFLPREAFKQAIEIVAMTQPRTDLEESMLHDSTVDSNWIELLTEARGLVGLAEEPVEQPAFRHTADVLYEQIETLPADEAKKAIERAMLVAAGLDGPRFGR